jgi:hypothetical protein
MARGWYHHSLVSTLHLKSHELLFAIRVQRIRSQFPTPRAIEGLQRDRALYRPVIALDLSLSHRVIPYCVHVLNSPSLRTALRLHGAR